MTALAPGLVEVRLHGFLRQRFGRSFWLAIDSAAEAISALCVLCKGFRQALRDFAGPGYRVRVGSGDKGHWRSASDLDLLLGQADRVDIVPVTHGAKRQGWGQVIVGAIIAVIGYFTAAYDGGFTMKAGISLMLGGAISLLTPLPKGSGSKAKEEVSRALNGPPNITSSGGPVPLIIGRCIVGSVTISGGISTDDVAIAVVDPNPTPQLPYEQADNPGTDPPGNDGTDADGTTGIGTTGDDGTGAVGVSAGDA